MAAGSSNSNSSSKWKKVKMALGGLNMMSSLSCVYGPPRNNNNNNNTSGNYNIAAAAASSAADNEDYDYDEYSLPISERRSDVALLVSPLPTPPAAPHFRTTATTSAPPSTTTTSNNNRRLGLSKSLTRSSSSSSSKKKTCSICLASMKRGDGLAIFTAECSHSFHFHCISSNVKHGNQVCPVCRAKWKEIPFKATPQKLDNNDNVMTVLRRLPPPRSNSSRNVTPMFQVPEPTVFNDDESLDLVVETTPTDKLISHKSPSDRKDHHELRKVNIKTYTEVSSVPRSTTLDTFTVLLHLKAPCSNSCHNMEKLPKVSDTPRAPVDLVTVLDISGSMAGTKLALLKRAMGFVIQNLGPNDRLSVIAFSSTARRLFPLRRMTEAGRQQALQDVNSLVASGGTNIAEGLRKGAKIMEDRREKNPVVSIILLSDGQDTYTVNYNNGNSQSPQNYEMLLPLSIRPDEALGFKIPVHTFGFGTDHDASSMHSISEISGGTFSFIETEGVIQDAFAQCIGGLLSVVVKDLHVRIDIVHPNIRLGSLKAGSYPNRVMSNQRAGSIDVGDLYADEERDFLVSINVPAEISDDVTSLLKVKCVYNDPLSKESVVLESEDVRIKRTEMAVQENVSVEVDRQMNRIRAAEAMGQARTAAEKGDLAGAVSILENFRKVLSSTVSAKSRDRLCVALDAEVKEMQERMASRHVYEASGRAYVLSGLSSHSWQRATARGDSLDGSSLVQAYQTPSMVQMVTRSQASLTGSPSGQRLLRGWSSFSSHPRPR